MKKFTITIGIPVFNEISNIGYLIDSIFNQNSRSYKLEKIIILCDGSTDGTDKKVLKLAKKYKTIHLINDRFRQGKTYRINQLFRINKSNFVIALDGDIILDGKNFINELLKGFNNKNIVICGANIRAVEEKSFIGKLINTWTQLWYYSRLNTNNGDNIFNIRGCAVAFRRSFIDNIHLDKKIISTTQYLYLLAISKRLHFNFAKEAIAIYRLPNTVSDYKSTISRGDNLDKKRIADILGNWIYNEYRIPLKNKISAVGIMLFKNPLYTIASIAFIKMLFLLTRNSNIQTPAVLNIAQSTKKGIDFN